MSNMQVWAATWSVSGARAVPSRERLRETYSLTNLGYRLTSGIVISSLCFVRIDPLPKLQRQ